MPVSATRSLELLLDRQRQYWEADVRIDVEQILEELSDGENTSDAVLDIIYNEVLLRSERGERPDECDYQDRFPHLTRELSALFDVHFALGDELIDGRSAAVPDSMRVAAPDMRIGHFEILERLGEGTFGIVWRAWDVLLERRVALKIPRATMLPHSVTDAVVREARAIAKINHPNIVCVYEVGTELDAVFIASELVDGCNLRTFCKGKPINAQLAARLCLIVARALGAAHSAGIVHRDLKPQNILINTAGTPFLTDFGLAVDLSAVDRNGSRVAAGTPAYMSPEQITGCNSIDGRSDVYSLGIVLYELLTGSRPREAVSGTSTEETKRADQTVSTETRTRMHRDLAAICRKAVEKNPESRYSSAEAMADDLSRFVAGTPVLARPTTAAERVVYRVRANGQKWWPVWIGSIVATLALVTLFNASQRGNAGLEGTYRVSIATEPPGAAVFAFPLDYRGDPQPELRERFTADDVPSASLAAGDYLLVAVHRDGRFHEVYRHVPSSNENLSGAFNHLKWTRLAEGLIELPPIVLPNVTVTSDMSLVVGQKAVTIGSKDLADCPEHLRDIPSYYMDVHEVTFDAYLRYNKGRPPMDTRTVIRPNDYAVTVSYDRAVHFAEAVGKRLPDEAEFEYAAGTIQQDPLMLPEQGPPIIGPVQGSKDHTTSIGPIWGLLSNVAEWTSSRAVAYPLTTEPGRSLHVGEFRDYRVVRGGNEMVIDGSEVQTANVRSPHERIGMSAHVVKPGLGFRCARSDRPRLLPSDFIRIVPK